MEEISSQNYTVSLSEQDLKNFSGWATFVAIIDIIVGALSCLGIITAAFGIPQIIAGVRLLNATDELKRYLSENDMQRVSNAISNLTKYFKLTGISVILKIVIGIIVIIVYIALIIHFISSYPDLFNNIPSGY